MTFSLSIQNSSYRISQFHNHAQQLKVKIPGGPLDNQTWQTEWKTAPLAELQLCENKKTNFGSFGCDQISFIQSLIVQWPTRMYFQLLLATVHDCKTGLLNFLSNDVLKDSLQFQRYTIDGFITCNEYNEAIYFRISNWRDTIAKYS